MRTKFKAWAEPYIIQHPDAMISLDEAKNLNNIELEIGCGKGKFLIDMANKNPLSTFVGVERNVTCCGFTCKKIVEGEINNAKLFFGDINKLLEVLPDICINNIYLNFSDPWPKMRHHKRRLTSDKLLEQYYRILKDGGLIIMKTDNVDLYDYSIKTFSSSKFIIVESCDDYIFDETNDAMSEYEIDFRNEGIKINKIVVRK